MCTCSWTLADGYVWLQNATQKSQKVFVHVPSEIAAHEVEEIGTPFEASIFLFVKYCLF